MRFGCMGAPTSMRYLRFVKRANGGCVLLKAAQLRSEYRDWEGVKPSLKYTQ